MRKFKYISIIIIFSMRKSELSNWQWPLSNGMDWKFNFEFTSWLHEAEPIIELHRLSAWNYVKTQPFEWFVPDCTLNRVFCFMRLKFENLIFFKERKIALRPVQICIGPVWQRERLVNLCKCEFAKFRTAKVKDKHSTLSLPSFQTWPQDVRRKLQVFEADSWESSINHLQSPTLYHPHIWWHLP